MSRCGGAGEGGRKCKNAFILSPGGILPDCFRINLPSGSTTPEVVSVAGSAAAQADQIAREKTKRTRVVFMFFGF